jgi:SOS-response transcriptional repressor LexA
MLSAKQKAVLDEIKRVLKASKGAYSPSVRELASATKTSIGNIQGHLRRLERDQHIHILPKTPRGIRLGKA